MSVAPFFTVVIPCYNCADLLDRALESVRRQTFQDFEVVVVDNSSTDHTDRVLDRYRADRMTVLKVQNHGVIGYSRNRGIEIAAGEWISFLDADDTWQAEKLETVHAEIQRHPKAVAFCHHETVISYGAVVRENRYAPRFSDVYESLLFAGNCMSTSAVAVRRDLALKLGGFSEREDFITVEDYEFWIRISSRGEIRFIPRPLGNFYIHGANSSAKARIHARAHIRVVEHHLAEWIAAHPRQRIRVQKGRSRIWGIGGRILLGGGNFNEARRYALNGIRFNPLNWKSWAVFVLASIRYPLPLHV